MAGVEESILRDQPARIGVVAPDSPAQKAGIRPFDVITSVDGQSVANWDEARYQIVMLTGKPYPIEVSRDGRTLTFRVTPVTSEILKQPIGQIGVGSSLPATVGTILDPSPALKAGLEPGDRIVSVNGEAVTYFDQLPALLAKSGDKPVDFVVERKGGRKEITVTPEWNEQEKRFVVGIYSGEDSVLVKYPFPSCLGKAWRITESMSTLVYRTIKGLVQRKVALSTLSGPVSIAYFSGEAARAGLNPLLWFVALISLQLGLFNLLPIPALDGGQLFILTIEGIVRRDLPMLVKERILQVGFGLLIVLMAFVLIIDTAKFFH
jgi:regulator of sigma E protease